MTPGSTVYIVDDEETIRRSLEMQASLVGIPACSFSSAEEFLNAYKPDWSGCLFADLRMPEINGLDLLHELRRRGTLLKLVLMSGHESADALVSLVGPDVLILEKPFSVSTFRELLQAHCALDRRPES